MCVKCQTFVPSPIKTLSSTNAESCIKNFIFASSSAIYGNHGDLTIKEDTGPLIPISNYGAMKLASEAICFAAQEKYLKKLRIFRFPNVVGIPATHGVIFDFTNKLLLDKVKPSSKSVPPLLSFI